jgi:hypothetical protein
MMNRMLRRRRTHRSFSGSLLVALLLISPAAVAQESPDYSRDTLLRIFAEQPEEEQPDVRFYVGAVEFRAMGSDWRFVYAPLLPLSGSIIGVTQEWPDPFALTRTAIATPARVNRSREFREELRRIDRVAPRARVRVRASGEN